MSYHDHFPGSTLDTRWTAVTAGAGTVAVTDSYAKLASPANADAAFIHSTSKIDLTKWQTITICIDPRNTGTSTRCFTIVNRASAPVATDTTTFDIDMRMSASLTTISSVLGVRFGYFDGSHVQQRWNGATNVWATADAHAYSIVEPDDYYEFTLEIDGPGARFRILGRHKAVSGTTYNFDQGHRYFAITDWVAFSGMETMSDLWLVLGDPSTSGGTGEARVEYVRLADGTRDHLWTNGRDLNGDPYRIKHWYTFDGEFAVPQDRTTIAIDIGTSGAWDDDSVHAKTVVQDGATIYMVYAGNDGSGYQLGLATATSFDGPWTKFGSNPIVARSVGTDEDAPFSCCLNLDNGEQDANKRAKLIYGSTSAIDGKRRLYYRTAPDPDGPWSASTMILGPGGASAYDEFGWGSPVFMWVDGQWEVWGATKYGTGASHEGQVARATGASLTALTKDPANPIVTGQVDAMQDLSANLNGRTASMASTAGFQVDGLVLVDQNATADDYSVSRIRKINTNASLELYHSLKGFTTASAAQVRQADCGSVDIHELRQVGSEWWLYSTPFAIFGSHATFNAHHETTGLYIATNRAGPYTIRWRSTPICGTTQWGNKRSSENIAFLRTPIASGGGGGGGGGGGTAPRQLRTYGDY